MRKQDIDTESLAKVKWQRIQIKKGYLYNMDSQLGLLKLKVTWWSG